MQRSLSTTSLLIQPHLFLTDLAFTRPAVTPVTLLIQSPSPGLTTRKSRKLGLTQVGVSRPCVYVGSLMHDESCSTLTSSVG